MVALFLVIYSHTIQIDILAMGMLGIFLLFNMYHINGFATTQFTTNAIDHEIAYAMNDAISQYEEETDTKIINIGFAEDSHKEWTYSSTFTYAAGDQNIRAWANDWARPEMFHYVTGRDFTIVPVENEIYQQYFEGKNWTSFNAEEQMIFIEDTVYLAIY